MEPSRPSVVVALATPFRDDGEVDLDAFAEHIAVLLDAGVDALMPCGRTGEGPLLDDEVSRLREHARGPAGVKRALAARLDGYPAALRPPLG